MMTLGRRKFDIYASHPCDALKFSVCINQPNSSITFYPIVVYLVYCCPLQRFSTTLQVTLVNNKVSFGHYSNLIVRVKRILKTAWTNSDFKKRIDLTWNFASTLTSIQYILKNPDIFSWVLIWLFPHILKRQLSMLGPLVHVFLEMGKINKNMLFHGIKAFPLETHLMLYRCFYIIIIFSCYQNKLPFHIYSFYRHVFWKQIC